MPAKLELLNSTDAADSSISISTEFFIETATASSACWKVIPQRHLLKLNTQRGEILSRQLEPRLMQLLCLLSQANGNVLTRETLMDALWPRVIVNENSLTRAVSELRKALAVPDAIEQVGSTNPAAGVSLIETVPKRGYRLNATVVADVSPTREKASLPKRSFLRLAIARKPALHYPAMVAAMIISAALSSMWTLKISDVQDPGRGAQIAQSALQTPAPSSPMATPINSSMTQRLEDRVVNESTVLPEGLHWLESVHNEQDSLSELQPSLVSATVLAPGGQMMAFIEDYPGQSQLRLRSLVKPDEAWTVFTSSSPITHLQWSPLDAGLLFTVQDKDGIANMAVQDALATGSQQSARLSRLMLLDLETLQIRELYRRIVPSEDDQIRTVGSLT